MTRNLSYEAQHNTIFASPTIQTTRDGSELVFPFSRCSSMTIRLRTNLEFEKTKSTILGWCFRRLSNVESSRSQTTDEKLVDVEVDDAFPPWKSTECIPTRFVCRVISNPLCFFPPPTPVDQIRPLSEDIHHPRSSLFSNSKRAASNEICSFEQRRIHPFFSPPPSRF